jgi:hypothetical protein
MSINIWKKQTTTSKKRPDQIRLLAAVTHYRATAFFLPDILYATGTLWYDEVKPMFSFGNGWDTPVLTTIKGVNSGSHANHQKGIRNLVAISSVVAFWFSAGLMQRREWKRWQLQPAQ